LERSFDGINFSKISIIPSAVNSTVRQNYSFSDPQIAPDISYYRLTMVDKDGQRKFSNIVTIKNTNSKQQLYVLTNPFKNNIIIRFDRIPLGHVSLQLTDLSGKTIKINELPSVSSQIYQWNLGQLQVSRGIYILTAKVEGKIYSKQLLKQ
jgi:hypothetical protein